MKSYLTLLISPILDYPDALTIDEIDDEQGKLFSVRVSKNDMGRVIGKEGQTVKLIRNFVAIVAARKGEKVSVKVLEPSN